MTFYWDQWNIQNTICNATQPIRQLFNRLIHVLFILAFLRNFCVHLINMNVFVCVFSVHIRTTTSAYIKCIHILCGFSACNSVPCNDYTPISNINTIAGEVYKRWTPVVHTNNILIFGDLIDRLSNKEILKTLRVYRNVPLVISLVHFYNRYFLIRSVAVFYDTVFTNQRNTFHFF